MDTLVSNAGLIVVVLGALILSVLLVDDGHRVLTGRTTFTVWATTPGKAYRKWLLVGATCLIPIGLAFHFQFFVRG